MLKKNFTRDFVDTVITGILISRSESLLLSVGGFNIIRENII